MCTYFSCTQCPLRAVMYFAIFPFSVYIKLFTCQYMTTYFLYSCCRVFSFMEGQLGCLQVSAILVKAALPITVGHPFTHLSETWGLGLGAGT